MNPKIIFAGGGTAGHVEPALAVANHLLKVKPNFEIRFIGTKNGLENQLVPAAGFSLDYIPKILLPRELKINLLLWPFKFVGAIWQGLKICKDADLIIGFGGYACPPVYLAAAILRKPILVHEANAIPGWANKLGVKFAADVFVAFSSAKQKIGKWRSAKLIGMPLRSEILEIHKLTAEQKVQLRSKQINKWKMSENKPILLVFGGSQGSRHINEAILQSLSFFTENNIQVVHSVGRNNPLPTSTENYLPVPYIEDMAAAYSACDLVIARSGALTCAELAAVGKFALLIPLGVGNGEQSANARDLMQMGAALIVEDNKFNADWLISNWSDLQRSAKTYVPKAMPDTSASEIISNVIVELVEKQNR
jgi:UDP-N-acetylglucosamine--N-acetylmuramyl-(pentapeptide) pyrophosphoryl-undecaprenol N-acetylglucosamine transferase